MPTTQARPRKPRKISPRSVVKEMYILLGTDATVQSGPEGLTLINDKWKGCHLCDLRYIENEIQRHAPSGYDKETLYRLVAERKPIYAHISRSKLDLDGEHYMRFTDSEESTIAAISAECDDI